MSASRVQLATTLKHEQSQRAAAATGICSYHHEQIFARIHWYELLHRVYCVYSMWMSIDWPGRALLMDLKPKSHLVIVSRRKIN